MRSHERTTFDDFATTEKRVARLHLVVATVFMLGGFGLMLLTGWLAHWKTFWEFMGAHYGVALFVAGSVGFGYEVLHLRREFRERVHELIAINNELITINDDRSAQQLPSVLARRLGGDRPDELHIELQEKVITIVNSIKKLDKEQLAASFVSVKSISVLLGYATRAADALAKAAESGGVHPLQLPVSAATVADEILKEAVVAMGDNDGYDVVSDYSNWVIGDIPQFWRATEAKVRERKVVIRRLFVQFDYDKNLSLARVMERLEEHWRLADETTLRRRWYRPRPAPEEVAPRYQVGICLNALNPRHVGVFRYGGKYVRFEPRTAGDLSEIDISRAEGSGLFEKLWPEAVTSYALCPDGHAVYRSFSAAMGEVSKREKLWFEKRFTNL